MSRYSYSSSASSGRKEKPRSKGSVKLSKLAEKRLLKDPEVFLDKLFALFTEKDSVMAAGLILRLVDGAPLPSSNNGSARLMKMIAKLASEPQWTPDMAKPAASATAASGEPENAEEEDDELADDEELTPEQKEEPWRTTRPCRNPVYSAPPAYSPGTESHSLHRQPAYTPPGAAISS